MKKYLQPLLLSAVVVLVLTSLAETQSDSSPAKRPTSPPYIGDLSIFDSPGREQKLQIGRVMDILGISEGKGVADIGAGSGWFTVRAARRVGALGKVYAVGRLGCNPDIERQLSALELMNAATIACESTAEIMVQLWSSNLFLNTPKLLVGATRVAQFQLVTSKMGAVTAFSGTFGKRRAAGGICGSSRELTFNAGA